MLGSTSVRLGSLFRNQFEQLIRESENDRFSKQLLKAIRHEVTNLLLDCHRGRKVKKSQIPQRFKREHDIDDLWIINLPGYWRLLYTIEGTEIEIITVLLEFMDHPSYDRLFGYRKK